MSFELLDHHGEARRAAVAADLADYFFSEMRGAGKKPEQRFSVSRLIRAIQEETPAAASYELSVCKAAALAQGRAWDDPRRQVIPWGALLSRDLGVAVPSRGGNLVGATTGKPMDILRPFSVVARMGVASEYGLTQELLLPNVTTAATAQWLADETSEITSSDPMVGQVSSTPKTAGTLIKASFQFMRQGASADEMIRTQLLGAIGGAIDQAVLAGTGASGQPTGLLLAAGVHEQSGLFTGFKALDALETLATSNADDEQVKFLSTPAIRRTLQTRAIEPGNPFMIWRQNQVADKPAFVSTDCPTGTVFAGDWSKVLVAFWGSGIEVSVDRFTLFKTGAIQVRATVDCDVIFTRPQAFVRHTSAT